MHFNDKPFDAVQEAKSLIDIYFKIVYEFTDYAKPSEAFEAAKRCAIREVESVLKILHKYVNGEYKDFTLILEQLKLQIQPKSINHE